MSTLRVDTVQTVAGVERYLANAWVNFNGTGVIAIRQDGNVSSLTDGGVGIYTVTFTSAIIDSSYAATATCQIAAIVGVARANTYATGSVGINTSTQAAAADADPISVVIVR
jgi:hypothetical protein